MGGLGIRPGLGAESGVTLTTRTSEFRIDSAGKLASVRSLAGGREYVPVGQASGLLSLRAAGKWHVPQGAEWDAVSGRLTLRYPSVGGIVLLEAVAKPTHVVFGVREIQSRERIEVALWGPYPTIISNIIGETIGVVRDPQFAIGIQSLNAKTQGGYPTEESDIESGFSGDDLGAYQDLPAELAKDQGYRGDTARTAAFGSVLQAFCRNRDRERVIPNWGHERFSAPAFADGGIVGSRIALFAGPASEALDTIGAIEVAEGLPHPMVDGVWGKASKRASESYLIVDFGEATIDRAIEMTRRAGLRYVYHSSPFETWGHFRLKPALFPNGWAGLRACVEKGRKAGVRIGLHTLSNFITPNDPYVTPKPDPRLARVGVGELAAEVTSEAREIEVKDPELFRKDSALNTVEIGGELIRYKSVSTGAPPWRLVECQRGAWGTRVAAHAKGARVARLMDHGYNVFLTDAELSQEMARTIARLCNETGIQQLSFDGLEGNWSTGMGQYGRTLFTQAWYDALEPGLRGQVINDASNPGHFNWHMYTRMNWGEPWYAGFRESQTLYRFKNQLYFERNLMPRMLGWFALRSETSLEDAEWLLARAAGFNAGFALASSLASTAQLEADPTSAEAARQSGAILPILETIRHWETARMAGAFSPEVRSMLRDNTREFQIESAGAGAWNLREAHTERLTGTAGTGVEGTFRNPHAAQPLRWVLRNTTKQTLSGVSVTIGGRPVVSLGDRSIPAGGVVRYAGGGDLVIADSAWREQARVPVEMALATVGQGEVKVAVNRPGGSGSDFKMELRTLGPVMPVPIPASNP